MALMNLLKRQPLKAQLDLTDAMREIYLMAGLEDQSARRYESISLGVTSPDFGDGKTTICTALTRSLAHDYGAEAMLVDADFHTHSIATDFGLDGHEGLSEIIEGTTDLEAVTYRVAKAPMRVVTAGRLSSNPARLARSERMVTLIDNMKRASKYVVIDLPAALHSMNTPILAQRCDAVIVVVRHGHTTRADLDRTLRLLHDSNVLGVVINRHKSSTPGWAQRALSLSD